MRLQKDAAVGRSTYGLSGPALRLLGGAVRQACIRYPLYSGCATLASKPAFCRLSAGLPATYETRLRNGARIWVKPDDFVGRSIFFFGDLDRKITWVLSRLVRPGDTVLDIGANVGVVTLRAAELVGKAGSVHAFEPQPGVRELLERSVALNGFSQVRVHPVALGDAPGRLELAIPDGNAGAASLVRARSGARTLEVSVVDSSDYLAGLGLGKIRLAKLDVEGYEETVLRGASPYFRENPPDVVLFERNDGSDEFSELGAVRLLDDLGYTFFDLPRALFKAHARPLDAKSRSIVVGHDIVAVRRSVAESVARSLGAAANG